MTTRSEIVSVIGFIGAEFVQNMMGVVAYIREEVVLHVSSQLGWCGIVAGVEAKPDSMLQVCLSAAQVKLHHAGDA